MKALLEGPSLLERFGWIVYNAFQGIWSLGEAGYEWLTRPKK